MASDQFETGLAIRKEAPCQLPFWVVSHLSHYQVLFKLERKITTKVRPLSAPEKNDVPP